MVKKRLKQLFIILILLFVIYPSFQVQAKVHNFSNINMEINVPEDTIILTKDTPNADEQWLKAGIADPKAEKDNFDDMGVQAILYDAKTKTMIRLLQKHSSESNEIFHLSQLSEEELTEFLDSLFTADNNGTKYSVEKYSHPETTFFRLSIDMSKDNVPLKEVIYGTIVNGAIISFDIFSENKIEPLDESYIKELVAGTHFTKMLDKEEVEQQAKEALIRFVIYLAIFIAIIIVWVLFRKKANKKKQVVKKRKAGLLEAFYREQRQKEVNNIKDTSLFMKRITYSEEVIKNFCYYNKFFKNMKMWIISILLYFALVISLFYSNASILAGIIAIVLFIIFLYYQGFQIENTIKRMMKAYENNKNLEAIYTFYEDYYTLSGIQSTSKYPYLQITEVKEYKDYIYLYLGTEKAHYLKKADSQEEVEAFKKFITERVNVK